MKSFAHVIGDPIAQSKSPIIHRFWIDQLGLDVDYDRAHVTSGELENYLQWSCDMPEWRGCNVTIPHKVAVMDLVDEDPDGVRDSIGAMNTVVADGGSIIGTNTDAPGFAATLSPYDVNDAHVAIVGAGGAARAVLFALKTLKVRRITILNRSEAKASALLTRFGLAGEVVPLDTRLADDVALVVNTSSLGMTGQPPLDIDLTPLRESAIIYDIVYAPLETALLAQARARGLRTIDGLEMLIEQAALAFELFFGAQPPRDRDAELRALLTA